MHTLQHLPARARATTDDQMAFAQISSRQLELLEEFPTELWVEVITTLDPRDVLRLSSVCHSILIDLRLMKLILLSFGIEDMPPPPRQIEPEMCLDQRPQVLLLPGRVVPTVLLLRYDESWSTTTCFLRHSLLGPSHTKTPCKRRRETIAFYRTGAYLDHPNR